MTRKAASKSTSKRPAARRSTGRARTPARKSHPARVVSLRGSIIGGDYWQNFSSSAIGPAEAIRVTSILGVVRWIAQAVGIMPVFVMRTLPSGRKQSLDLPCSYTLRKRPNPWQSSYDFYQLIAYWTALHGNAFARIMSGDRGWCSELRPMHPTRVRVHRDLDYTVWYEFLDNDNRWIQLDAAEVLHWRWLSDNGLVGMPPAELCETSIALARKLDAAATSFWDNSARPDLVLETDEKIPDEAVDALRNALREVYGGAHNRGKTAVLPKKTRLKPIESNSMEANQFQELRDAILPDVCRCWGVPSTLLGDSKMARWSNVEQEHLAAQTWCLLPWMRRMEGPLDMALQPVYGEDVYTRFDNRGLLRGDTSSRVSLYQAMFNMGALAPNELRDLEDFDLLEKPEADETYMQLGFSTLANAAASAAVTEGEPAGDDAGGRGEGVPEAGGFREGQYVYWAGGEGVIEHLMISGLLGVEGSPFAIAATEAEPAALVRIYDGGQPTEMLVGKRTAELSATAVGSAPTDETAPAMVAGGVDLQATALNGAQVTALLEVLAKVSAGELEAAAAVAVITSSFPTVSEDLARQMVDGAIVIPREDQSPEGQ